MKKNRKLTVLLSACIIGMLAGLLSLTHHDAPTSQPTNEEVVHEQQDISEHEDPAPEEPVQTPDIDMSDVTTSSGYRPTTWDPNAAPDMYKIHGKAMILSNKLAPGDIDYKYDKETKTQSVSALLTYKNIEYGKRERESISDIEPIGWPEDNARARVTFPSGETYNGWFWNRSHLLGHALGGDDEEYNLVTGTRAQNVGTNDMHGGMQYAETLVRDYFDAHPDGYVYYMVHVPYAQGENIPRSVFLDIKSDDRSIDMHLEVYNVMPGYDIDYKTGTFRAR